MSSEKLHDATSADGDASPCPEISQRPRVSFLKRLKSFCRYSKCSETHEYESHPSDYQEEPSVLLPEQIRADQLVTYFNNNLEKFYNNFNQKHHNVSTCGSVIKSVCPMSFDGQGGYHLSCQFRDGEDWDIYYFEEPVSNYLSVILEESTEGENMVLNRMTSQPAIEETSRENNETHGTEVKETISPPAAVKELSNACGNESNYESNIIEELVEHYLNPDSKDPHEDSSASSIYSLEIAGTGVSYPKSIQSIPPRANTTRHFDHYRVAHRPYSSRVMGQYSYPSNRTVIRLPENLLRKVTDSPTSERGDRTGMYPRNHRLGIFRSRNGRNSWCRRLDRGRNSTWLSS